MSVSGNPLIETEANNASSKNQSQYYMERDSARAEVLEKAMTVWEALRLWWPAILCSIGISTGMIMQGYDNLLLPQFFAMTSFCKRYGVMGPTGTYEVPALWQAGLTNGCVAGEIIGLYISAYAVEKFGYRKTLGLSLSALTVSISLTFFSESKVELLIGEFFCGIPFGIFQALTCVYASDVSPVKLRPYLTTYTNVCWVIGQLMGSSVLRVLANRTDEWSYRIPFALQWFWPIPIAIAIYYSPESPWWLVRQGRYEEAKMVLIRLISLKNAPQNFSVDDTLAMIIITNKMEKEQAGDAGYRDCFKNSNLRRTEISCIAWMIQNLCGSAFMNFSTYFFVQAGLPTLQAFNMSLVQYSIGFLGTLNSWYLMGKFGRRTLFGVGLLILFFILIGIGVAGMFDSEASGWAIGSMLLLYTAVYNSTVGPITYSLVSEIPATCLKNKTVVLARNLYNVTGIVNNIAIPYMLNPTAWHWGGKSGFFWAGMCSLSLLWSYFRIPEPKDRSFADLDDLFKRRISARKFSVTVIEKE